MAFGTEGKGRLAFKLVERLRFTKPNNPFAPTCTFVYSRPEYRNKNSSGRAALTPLSVNVKLVMPLVGIQA